MARARIAFTERLTSSPYTEQLYSAHFDGTTWTSGPNPLAPEDPNDQAGHYPSIAIGDEGSGIVLFTQKDSSRQRQRGSLHLRGRDRE